MEQIYRYVAGAIAALVSLLAPVQSLIICAVVFVGIDFVTGVVASYKRARKQQSPWAFESEKAWATILKLCFVMCGIVLAWLIDNYILTFVTLNLAKIFTGFVCGIEFWSYLENASEISQNPIFRQLRNVIKQQVDKTIPNGEQGSGAKK